MDNYITLQNLAANLHLNKGDNVFVTSDVKQLLYDLYEHNDETDLNILIDGIIDIIGEEGTLVFPTFNWSFCKGVTFDIKKTPCKTGSLGTLALKRNDFRRTKHPIYSFAVWGKGQDELCAIDNQSSFGADSPFTYFTEHHFKNLFIDKDLEHSFVYVHYCEQQVGNLKYRYLKDFYADYIDEDGNVKKGCYSMNVRDLDLDVTNRIYPFEDEFIEKGIMERFFINNIEYKIIDLYKSYPIITEDVKHNRSRKICSYIGQDDTIHLDDGKKMFALCEEIFPICRSITGNGVRDTFKILNRVLKEEAGAEFNMYEVESGTKVLDWTVPNEWNVTEAYLEDEEGNTIVDFKDNNLRLLGYSTPVDEWLTLDELKEHIYTLKEQPDLIPYTTSYYKERWGFCMSVKELEALCEKDASSLNSDNSKKKYHAVIKSTLQPGSLTYGELLIPGESEKEIFFSSYTCHPSMANNECSGPALMIYVAKYILSLKKRKYSYRLVLAPETIGALTYISRNLKELQDKVICAFNLTCVGDDRTYSIIHSKYGNTLADKVLTTVLKSHDPKFGEYSYLKRGSDERQYQAPGVDIPMVCFCRSKYHIYPEYHTSADNLDIISPDGLGGSLDVMIKCIDGLEANAKYRITCLGEPQLGKRGLMPTMSSKETYKDTLAMKDICAYADGSNDLFELSEIIEQPLERVVNVVNKLKDAGLLEEVSGKDK